MSTVPPEPPPAVNFYHLGFPAQMVVWATRKRLHLLASGADDANAAQAFRMAGLAEPYAALMSVLDLLLCVGGCRIALHGVACARLAPHEVSLVNALAYLQAEDETRARRAFDTLAAGPAASCALPVLREIAVALREHGLTLAPLSPGAPAQLLQSATLH
jgi:hypothetical protein